MSIGGLLTQVATVYRRPLEDAPDDELDARTDAFGQRQVQDTFGQPLRASEEVGEYPCRVTRPTGGETFEERSHDVAQDQRTLYLLPTADVREDDEVTVRNRDGRVVVSRANVKLLKEVIDGPGIMHHLELRLTTQRPSGGLAEESP